MITESQIYWITRLDNILGLGVGLCVVGLVAVVAMAFYAVMVFDCEKVNLFKCKVFVALWLFCVVIVLIGAGIRVFVPSTKEAMAIYGIPKLVNSEFVQKQLPDDGQQVYKAAKEYLLEKLKDGKEGK